MVETGRPQISIYIAMSIDGFIARRDGSIDWLEYGHTGDEDYGFKAFFSSIDTLILGRKTYEVVSSFAEWPYSGKRVIVLSNSLRSVREEAEVFCGPLEMLVSKLRSEGVEHVWIDGGVTVSQFLGAGLVDRMTISVLPIILGSGIPLFSQTENELICRLTSSKSYPSGLIQLRYDIVH